METAEREKILAIRRDLLIAEEHGYEGNILMRIRLHSLADRAAALLAKIEGGEA
jgi:hypothetical protein